MTYLLLLLFALVACTNAPKAKFADDPQKETPAVSPAKPDTVRSIAVVYRSIDKGKTWSSFANGIPANATVTGFATNKNKVFAATKFNGVLVWESGSDKWKPVTGIPDDAEINAIAVDDKAIVVGTFKQGFFVSPDEGNTWRPSAGNLQNIPVRNLMVIKDKILAGTDNGIYVSTDKGDSWKHLFGTMQVNGFTYLNGKVYAAVVNGALMSKYDGRNWNYIYQPHTLHDISNDGKYIYAMTMGEGLLKTSNDGMSWQNADKGLPALYTFEVKNINSDLFAAQWHGIYYSANAGNNWSKINTGFNGLPDSTAFTTLEVTAFGILTGIGLRK
jgi:photosystem II stability/assembly factor-like uncharacterized protein